MVLDDHLYCAKIQKMTQEGLLLAHRQEVYLYGLYNGLKNEYQNVKMAQTGAEALHSIIESPPKVAMLDADLPVLSAFDIMRMVSERGIETKFIIIFPDVQHEYLVAVHSLRVSGTLNAADSFNSIKECLDSVLQGATCFSKEDSSIEIDLIHDILRSLESLSETEKQVLCLIGERLNTVQIANALGISKRTIEKHRSNIITKLHLVKKTNSLTNWVHKNERLVKTLKFTLST